MRKLASGLRIDRASDDPAGLMISERMRGRIAGLERARINTNEAISAVRVAEGGLSESSSLLIRMRELAVQASSDHIGAQEREVIGQEAEAIASEIDRISAVTRYSGRPLLREGFDFDAQTGAGSGAADRLTIETPDSSSAGIGVDSVALGASADDARASLETIDQAIRTVASQRASLGSKENILESRLRLQSIEIENTRAAESRIRDVDVAEAMAELTKAQVGKQAAIATFAQAKTQTEVVLELLEALD